MQRLLRWSGIHRLFFHVTIHFVIGNFRLKCAWNHVFWRIPRLRMHRRSKTARLKVALIKRWAKPMMAQVRLSDLPSPWRALIPKRTMRSSCQLKTNSGNYLDPSAKEAFARLSNNLLQQGVCEWGHVLRWWEDMIRCALPKSSLHLNPCFSNRRANNCLPSVPKRRDWQRLQPKKSAPSIVTMTKIWRKFWP